MYAFGDVKFESVFINILVNLDSFKTRWMMSDLKKGHRMFIIHVLTKGINNSWNVTISQYYST